MFTPEIANVGAAKLEDVLEASPRMDADTEARQKKKNRR
jgi:hypothetical protein